MLAGFIGLWAKPQVLFDHKVIQALANRATHHRLRPRKRPATQHRRAREKEASIQTIEPLSHAPNDH
jgi:hypothetical protein